MTKEEKAFIEQLEVIKKLLILHLLNSKVPANVIAMALGTNKSVISRMVPARKLMKILNKIHKQQNN